MAAKQVDLKIDEPIKHVSICIFYQSTNFVHAFDGVTNLKLLGTDLENCSFMCLNSLM